MYSANKLKHNKKAPLLLLIVMSIFALLVSKSTKTENTTVLASQDTEIASCSSDIVDQSYEEDPIFINLGEGGAVLAETDDETQTIGGMTCSSVGNQYTASSICTIPSGTGTVSLQGWVSSQASVEMVSITVPVRLLSGIFSLKDSNREISLVNPVYKPAGEQFDERQILVNTPPSVDLDRTKSQIVEGSAQKQSYSVRYTISTTGENGGGDAAITEYATNDCGEMCNNPDNNNPDKSNRIAEKLNDYKYKTPMKEDPSNDAVLKISGECGKLETVPVEEPSLTTCFSIWKAISGAFGTLFPSSDWTNCEDEEEGCINSEDIVVKMSPIFKETNTYMTARNKSAMDPGKASSHRPYYIVTPCSATVAGKLLNLKCLWDMSYLFEELQAARYDDTSSTDTPTVEQYKSFLQQEASTREDELYPM